MVPRLPRRVWTIVRSCAKAADRLVRRLPSKPLTTLVRLVTALLIRQVGNDVRVLERALTAFVRLVAQVVTAGPTDESNCVTHVLLNAWANVVRNPVKAVWILLIAVVTLVKFRVIGVACKMKWRGANQIWWCWLIVNDIVTYR